MWRVAGIVLQPVENGPAGHVGQIDIEGDGARRKFARQGKRGPAAQGHQHLDATVMREVEQNAGEGDIVFDDQQHGVAGLNQIAVVVDFDVVHDGGRRCGRRRQDDIDGFALRHDNARRRAAESGCSACGMER